jgi:hypothetical protein
MGEERQRIRRFLNDLVGRLAGTMPCPGLDADQVGLTGRIGLL